MSFIIGLVSMRPTGMEMVYVRSDELQHETLFRLERSIRTATSQNPLAELQDVLDQLDRNGFSRIVEPIDTSVFIHSRAWDEHLFGYGQSFFVCFPEDASYEVKGEMMLASRCPLLYTSVGPDFHGKNQVVVINKDHDPIYGDDEVWADENQTQKRPLGGLIVLRDQFIGDEEYLDARRTLMTSGYQVVDDANTHQAGKGKGI